MSLISEAKGGEEVKEVAFDPAAMALVQKGLLDAATKAPRISEEWGNVLRKRVMNVIEKVNKSAILALQVRKARDYTMIRNAACIWMTAYPEAATEILVYYWVVGSFKGMKKYTPSTCTMATFQEAFTASGFRRGKLNSAKGVARKIEADNKGFNPKVFVSQIPGFEEDCFLTHGAPGGKDAFNAGYRWLFFGKDPGSLQQVLEFYGSGNPKYNKALGKAVWEAKKASWESSMRSNTAGYEKRVEKEKGLHGRWDQKMREWSEATGNKLLD
jgi:hypothetical protein